MIYVLSGNNLKIKCIRIYQYLCSNSSVFKLQSFYSSLCEVILFLTYVVNVLLLCPGAGGGALERGRYRFIFNVHLKLSYFLREISLRCDLLNL